MLKEHPFMGHAPNHSLPEDIVERIIAEERLRLQVREELERAKKTQSTSGLNLWAFLNSGFGIFLLSSIFVTGLGGLFTYWTQHNKEKEERVREEKRLLAEFDFRLKELETRITQINSTNNIEEKGTFTVFIWRAARGDGGFQAAVPEFRNVHWADIVIQLDSFGISENSAAAIAAIRDFETLAGQKTPGRYTVFPDGYLEQREKTLRSYSEKAWKKVDPKRVPGLPTLQGEIGTRHLRFLT
jgi:hypothetical protein